jgi:hypothetical protein
MTNIREEEDSEEKSSNPCSFESSLDSSSVVASSSLSKNSKVQLDSLISLENPEHLP